MKQYSKREALELLKTLMQKAEYRRSLIIENGREITDEERARSDGYVGAYQFAIYLIENFK